jgi:hypothetical protein
MDFSVNVSGMSLYCARLYAQNLGDAAVSVALANQFRNLTLTRRQTIAVLYVPPLFLVQQYDVGSFEAGLIAYEILGL